MGAAAVVAALPEGRRERRQAKRCANMEGGINMCLYKSHDEMVANLRRLQDQYPFMAMVGDPSPPQGRDGAGEKQPLRPVCKFARRRNDAFGTDDLGGNKSQKM